MKCPLTLIESYHDGQEFQPIHADCLKKECAWWVDNNNECAMRCIGGWLVGMVTVMDRINDKMPHAGQFTK